MIGTILTKISSSEDITMVTLNNIPTDMKLLGEMLNAFAKEYVNLDMICQSAPYGGHINVSFTLEDKDLPRALKISGLFKSKQPNLRIDINPSNAKLNFYGERMKDNPGVAAYLINLFLNNDALLKLITIFVKL